VSRTGTTRKEPDEVHSLDFYYESIKNKPELSAAIYQVLASRRISYDTLMWQVPILSFTAQAFLMTIALNTASSAFDRLVPSFLGVIVSILSLQLMAKHRDLEMLDSFLLHQFETINSWPPLHSKPFDREKLLAENYKKMRDDRAWYVKWSVKPKSYSVWMIGLSMFLIAWLIIIIITLVDLSGHFTVRFF